MNYRFSINYRGGELRIVFPRRGKNVNSSVRAISFAVMGQRQGSTLWWSPGYRLMDSSIPFDAVPHLPSKKVSCVYCDLFPFCKCTHKPTVLFHRHQPINCALSPPKTKIKLCAQSLNILTIIGTPWPQYSEGTKIYPFIHSKILHNPAKIFLAKANKQPPPQK